MGKSLQKQTDKTSADTNELGFEYQYLCFIEQLLLMKEGEEVGYEDYDDIHVIKSNEKINYIQVKHTTSKSSDGSKSNLTDLSIDLWKTLYNWVQLITDSADYRDKVDAQLNFLENSIFTLFTNRNIENNKVVCLINQKITNAKKLRSELSDILSLSTNSTIKDYAKKIYSLNDNVLISFFNKISIVNKEDDIYENIKKAICNKMIKPNYADAVFNSLYSQLKQEFFMIVNLKKHQVITYDHWIKKYTSCFSQYRETTLPFKDFKYELPKHLNDQNFVKELVEIEALDKDDLSEIVELTTSYFDLNYQLNDWHEEGLISRDEINSFDENAHLAWKRIHKQMHLKTRLDQKQDFENAQKCYCETLREKLLIRNENINLKLSNGEFIKLADKGKIAWKYKNGKDVYIWK